VTVTVGETVKEFKIICSIFKSPLFICSTSANNATENGEIQFTGSNPTAPVKNLFKHLDIKTKQFGMGIPILVLIAKTYHPQLRCKKS